MYIRQQLRERLIGIKARTVVRNISKKPILIFATRRGGSTLLADMVACNRGIWFADEPFAVYESHPGFELKSRLLPKREHSQYFNLSGTDLARFNRYLNGLLHAQYSDLGTCRHVKFLYRADRVCLKILNAPLMLDWVVENIDCHVLFLTRHPATQAQSVLRLGWEFGVSAYFRNPEAVGHLFSDEQIAFAIDLVERSNPWEIAILDWVIHTHCGRNTKANTVVSVRFEDLVFDPTPVVENVMCKQIGLSNIPLMLEKIQSPSNSSHLSTEDTRESILTGRHAQTLSKWVGKLSHEQKTQAQVILDVFDVTEYDMYSPVPLA